MSGRKREKSVAIFLLGLLLFSPPLLSMVEGRGPLVGIPLIYLYFFACWAVLILLSWLVAKVGAAD